MRSRGPGRAPVYRAYGVRLQSPWPLPCAPRGRSGLVRVELSRAPASRFGRLRREANGASRRDDWFRYFRHRDGSEYLRWSGLFEFVVSADGGGIACRPLNGASREAFHTYLLGQVLSFALLKQGIEPLHATAVVIDGEAVAFVGDCGYGKSSLGAAFLRAGCPLLTDDLLVVTEEGGRLLAHPGVPRIKLFPEVAGRLLGGWAAGSPMNNATPKLVIPLPRPMFWQRAVPLKAIYVLGPPSRRPRGGRVTLRSLPARRAVLELLKNTFNPVVVEPARLERQLEIAVRLARRIPVKSLAFPRRLGRLAAVVETIRRGLAS